MSVQIYIILYIYIHYLIHFTSLIFFSLGSQWYKMSKPMSGRLETGWTLSVTFTIVTELPHTYIVCMPMWDNFYVFTGASCLSLSKASKNIMTGSVKCTTGLLFVVMCILLFFIIHHYRATNLQPGCALVQVMEKGNRLEHLVDEGAFLRVREVRCGKCGQQGHYKTTCRL